MDPKVINQLDRIVWDALSQVRLPDKAKQLNVVLPVSEKQWNEYWTITRQAACGYWHGATAIIAERLNISDEQWKNMVQFHQPESAGCLGDSSHDYSYLVEESAIFGHNQPT